MRALRGVQVDPWYPRHINTKECQIGVEQKAQQDLAAGAALAFRCQFTVHGDVLECQGFQVPWLPACAGNCGKHGAFMPMWGRYYTGITCSEGGCLVLQGSHPSCLAVWQRDVESYQIGLDTAMGVPRTRCIQDGEGASTKEGGSWGLEISEHKVHSGRMQHGICHHIYPGPLSDNWDVLCNQTNFDGLSGGQTAERFDATDVVVGATGVPGHNQCNWI